MNPSLRFGMLVCAVLAAGCGASSKDNGTKAKSAGGWKTLPLVKDNQIDPAWKHTGYGTFVEAACCGLPVLYLQRPDWPEAECLEAWLHQNARAAILPPALGLSGEILPAVNALLARPAPPRPVADGMAQALRLINGTATVSSPISLNSDAFIGVASGATLTQTGIISGPSASELRKVGAGNLVLTAANDHAGSTVVSQGTLTVRNALALIDTAHPELGRHLRHAVRTGVLCCYDPETPTTWDVVGS